MSEWLHELAGFYAVPIVIGVIYVFAAAGAADVSRKRSILAAITVTAILLMWTVPGQFSPPTIYLGQVPGLREGLGSLGIVVAAAVLFNRTGKRADAGSVLENFALGVAAFLCAAIAPVGLFLLMVSMNPD